MKVSGKFKIPIVFSLFMTLLFSCTGPECGIEFSRDEEKHISKGELLQQAGEFDQAISEYAKAIKINRYNYVALSDIASCIFEKDGMSISRDSLSICLDMLEYAIELCPEFRPAYTNIITITSDYQIANLAVHYGGLYNSVFTENCYINTKIAKSYLEMLDTLNARLIISKQLDVGCNDPDLFIVASKYHQVVGDTLKAKKILTSLIEEEPSNSVALTEIGKLLSNIGNTDEAKLAYQEALL